MSSKFSPLNRLLLFIATGTCALLSVNPTSAAVFLVGGHMYRSDTSSGINAQPGYRFTTNSQDTGGSGFPLDFADDTPDAGVLSRDIAFELNSGVNTFNFSIGAFAVSAYGVSLYFSTDPTPLTVLLSTAVAGDLTVFSQAGSGIFAFPVAGTAVGGFGSSGLSPTYNGNQIFELSETSSSTTDYFITVTDFTVDNAGGGPGGSFEIVVTPAAIPEPRTVTLVIIGLACLGWHARRKL